MKKEFLIEIVRKVNGFETFKVYNVPLLFKAGTEKVSGEQIKDFIASRLPAHFFRDLKQIIVGYFPQLDKAKLSSNYENNTIQVTNSLKEEDIISAIIHELAHHAETLYNQEIYSDGSIASEFLGKRQNLFRKISSKVPETDPELFKEVEFNNSLQDLFYKTIGLDAMTNFVVGLFPSPYAAVSLKEYWAIGFENFIMDVNSNQYTKSISPHLYQKLSEIYYET